MGQIQRCDRAEHEQLQADLAAARSRVAVLEAALGFYADGLNYEWRTEDGVQYVPAVDADFGRKAAAALAGDDSAAGSAIHD